MVNKTGRYVYDRKTGSLVKVSDNTPSIGAATSSYCGPVKEPYYEEHLGPEPVLITSRSQKARELQKRGLVSKENHTREV